MGSMKSSLLYAMTLMTFVSQALAQELTHPITSEPTHVLHEPGESHPLHQDHDHDQHAPLTMSKEEFFKQLPAEPAKALEFVFSFLNQGESQAHGRNNTYVLRIVDKVDTEEMIDIKPRFTDGNQIVFEFYVQKNLLNNPLYAMEIFKALYTFTDPAVNSGVKDSATTSYSYKDVVYKVGPHGHTYAYYHPDHHHKTVHYHTHEVHSMITMLGAGRTDTDKYNESPLKWAERVLNAQEGSAYAAREVKDRELSSAKAAMLNYPKFHFTKNLSEETKKAAIQQMAKARGINLNASAAADDMAIEYFTTRATRLQKELDIADKAARAQYAAEKKYFDDSNLKARKDKAEAMAQKLDDLVKSNDREGTAKLLETFLPLDIMEPVEKGLWQDFIEAIRHPDVSNAKLLFRGLDKENDKLQTSADGKRFGLFSTLLVRNQGSYTRRLRSFATMRYRFLNTDSIEKSPVEIAPTILAMMSNHAGNPTGSPLLSFSTNIDVAKGFASSGIIAVKIDPRRTLPNIASGFANELEMLVPLIVFPDEIVASQLQQAKDQPIDHMEFMRKLNTKLGHDFGEDTIKGTRDVYLGAYKVLANAVNLPLIRQCGGLFK